MLYAPGPPRIAYSLAGLPDGPLLVLVGGLGSAQAGWLLQVRAFAGRARVLTYDHRGTGESELVDAPTAMTDYARDLVGLLDYLGVASADFVGLSFGGRVLQTLALDWPERVASLVLGGTSAGGRGHTAAAEGGMRALGDAALADEDAEALRWETELIPALFGARYRARYPDRVRHFARWRARHALEPRGVARQWEAYGAFDVSERLGEIKAPTLILHGSDDQVSPLENARFLHERIPGSRLVVLEGVGHSANVEDPEAFNKAIMSFLDSLSP